ncbi:hypothetical protein D8I24_5559 [Cupriavidus necator H850]|uniref:glycosyltransferase family protein n=1 Tax=Cupriavidus necator TaxID=106590 RepID=UPI0020C1203A|nr:glycosyltransferase family 1 protein [Cupriavidus necator]KAI3598613.1 hypothetical protein D8I24_5559 [Cupriavidus necator H850]
MGLNESIAEDFNLPAGLVGRFAVVKLWPAIKTAEDECIARLKIAAAALGLECIEIHADGRLIEAPETVVGKKDVDFVLHLHYDTPKFYDVFSFVALWNPLQFYHEWGYQRTSRNLLTHDDFISCSSRAADDHVARMVRNERTHLPSLFNLYHSIADVVYPPSLGDQKLFYIGINWEAINGGKSRHQDVLKRLDQTGLMRIYGPSIFQGVRVWEGYKSYVREIPFDGISMLQEISKAGIALVLSSQAHRNAELMSNRLFESVAAGALVICDENKFASRFFGDSLLYIDSRCSGDKIFEDIQNHLAWAKANPQQALAKIAKAQRIFREKFSLTRNIRDLYLGLNDRKSALLRHQGLERDAKGLQVGMYLLMPTYSEEVLRAHVKSVVAQEYTALTPLLVVDKAAAREHAREIGEILASSPVVIELLEIDFFDYGPIGAYKSDRKVGAVIADLLSEAPRGDAVIFVAPNETLYSNHVQVLAGSLMRNPVRDCVATAAIMKNGDAPVHGVHEHLEFGFHDANAPIGFGRFIFRLAGLAKDLGLALPYLHLKPLAALVGESKIYQEIPSTIVIDLQAPFPAGNWHQMQENELLGDYAPKSFTIYRGFIRDLPSLAPRIVPQPPTIPYSRFSRRWVLYQIKALREMGPTARIKHLGSKVAKKIRTPRPHRAA